MMSVGVGEASPFTGLRERDPGSQLPNQRRPLAYRAWSGLRTQQLLQFNELSPTQLQESDGAIHGKSLTRPGIRGNFIYIDSYEYHPFSIGKIA
jgi:hypothetical protein